MSKLPPNAPGKSVDVRGNHTHVAKRRGHDVPPISRESPSQRPPGRVAEPGP